MLIPEYFTDKEIICRCGCGLMPDRRSVQMLYALRIIYNESIIITSGARCPTYNKKIGGAGDSAHIKGAFDMVVPPNHEWRVIQIAQFVGFTGIGIDDNKMLHIDRHHDREVVWTY